MNVTTKPKLRVAWICHFSNQEVRNKIIFSEINLKSFVKKLLGKKVNVKRSDYAVWITNLIKEFKELEDIELHIIAPIEGIIGFTFEFESNGVYYHFYNSTIPVLGINFTDLLRLGTWSKYYRNRFLVRKFLRQIKPDIVNLIGTENPYYSISTLDIRDIPVYVLPQTVYTNPLRKRYSDEFSQLKWNVELKIHQKHLYYGCSDRLYRDLILHNNPNALIFKVFFPITKIPEITYQDKVYDFVFFAAQVSKKKGIEDAIDALSIVKKHHENVTLNIIGTIEPDYRYFLNDKINSNGLSKNIIFNDYFSSHIEMFCQVKKAKFALLPVKLDTISNTIIEAILLELPVITYKTTGTPFLNRDNESVLLASIDDTIMLANQMLKLLDYPELAANLILNAKCFIEKEFDNSLNAARLVQHYKATIEHFHHRTAIPKELLFDVDEFPHYC